jgi:hypothetical protein
MREYAKDPENTVIPPFLMKDKDGYDIYDSFWHDSNAGVFKNTEETTNLKDKEAEAKLYRQTGMPTRQANSRTPLILDNEDSDSTQLEPLIYYPAVVLKGHKHIKKNQKVIIEFSYFNLKRFNNNISLPI